MQRNQSSLRAFLRKVSSYIIYRIFSITILEQSKFVIGQWFNRELKRAICFKDIGIAEKEVKHVRVRMKPSYYRGCKWGMETERWQDRTRKGLFSPEIRCS
jgi:hypothetical protein